MRKKIFSNFTLAYLQGTSAAFAAVCAIIVRQDYEAFNEQHPTFEWAWNFFDHGAWLIGLAIFTAVSIVSLFYVGPQVKNLINERDELRAQNREISENIDQLFMGILLNYSKKLNFLPDGRDRLTVYYHLPDLRHFVPIGRYSRSPEYTKKGRTTFPDNEGCISRAWLTDWHIVNIEIADEIERKRKFLEDYALSVQTFEQLRMPAQFYAAKRIETAEDRHIGVLVLESTEAARYNEEDVKQKMDEMCRELGRVIQVMEKHIATPQEAERYGL